MGYDVHAFLVPPGAMDAFIGSSAPAPLEALRTRTDVREGVKDAVRELSLGRISTEAHRAADVLYAAEWLCEHFGTRARESIRLNPTGLRATRELELLLRTKLPVALPTAVDFPSVGYMPIAVIDLRLAKAAHLSATSVDAWHDLPRWLVWGVDGMDAERLTYLGWIRDAGEARRDLWFFHH